MLVSMSETLRRARDEKWAVGYFETWDLQSMKSVIEAAEEERSPVIVGWNGGGGLWGHLIDPGDIHYYAAIGRPLAEKATVPVALELNEATGFQQVIQAIRCGFTYVMYEAAEGMSFKKYTNIVKKIVEAAHSVGVLVEGQVGEVPPAEGYPTKGGKTAEDYMTDPEEATRFVKATGIDVLSASIGNVHRLYWGKAKIDLNRLKRISVLAGVPLTMHGGTGFPDGLVGKAVEMDVCKFNVATELRVAWCEEVSRSLKEKPITRGLGVPHPLEIMRSLNARMKKSVKRRLRLFGSSGKCGS